MSFVKLEKPPLGWNSFDCYGIFINEEQALANLDAFDKKLKPHGYEYFCIDAGWYSEYEFQFDPEKPIDKGTAVNVIDEYGRMVASPRLFPRGMKYIADKCHEKGFKFGIHIMRGIPRVALKKNTPVKGTSYRAADIANQEDICLWNPFFYGVDMTKPGAQEYYDSVIEYLAECGVDFIKADDIVEHPDEIKGVSRAIEKCSRPMVLSLSPGNKTTILNAGLYRECANMLRITSDVWDRQSDLDKSFERWGIWQNEGDEDLLLDLDMIPFGALQVYSKDSKGGDELLAGVGSNRMSNYTIEQKRTFITQRALAASPLIMGGELNLTPDEDFALIINADMLECNQNCRTGKTVFAAEFYEVWKAESKSDSHHGWLGIFNRFGRAKSVTLSAADLGLEKEVPSKFYSIWEKLEIDFTDKSLKVELEPNDVLFLKY